MALSQEFSPIPSLFSSLLPTGWLPDSCLGALFYPSFQADRVSSFNFPFPFATPKNLSFSRPSAPANLLVPDPVLVPTTHYSRSFLLGVSQEDWKDRFPARPFLPSDLAWSRAAGNWNCRSSSDSHSLGLWRAGRAPNCWRTAPWRAGKGKPLPSANGGCSLGVFMVGFEGTPLTKWPCSFSDSKIPDRRNERRSVCNLTWGMNFGCLNFSTAVSLALLKVTEGRIWWWELLTSFNRNYTTSPAF